VTYLIIFAFIEIESTYFHLHPVVKGGIWKGLKSGIA
jgi:hypothetical protein